MDTFLRNGIVLFSDAGPARMGNWVIRGFPGGIHICVYYQVNSADIVPTTGEGGLEVIFSQGHCGDLYIGWKIGFRLVFLI